MTFFNGNISIAAETKYVEKICDTATTFSVAENRPLRNGQTETVFHRITIYGKRGKNLQEYLYLGRPVIVFGYEKAKGYINKKGEAVAYLQMTNAKITFPTKNAKGGDPATDAPDEEILVDEIVEEDVLE